MAHDSTVRRASPARHASPLRKSLWTLLPTALAAALVAPPHAHAQNTANGANGAGSTTGAATAGNASTFNPSADISRAVSRDTTDAAIQNNWNSIMRPPVQAKPEEKPADSPRRNRRGITPGISTN
ncbi:hypothetical protein AB870_11455 [Pandoraea faecigallinarum]|uniref:Uncharacterized protein n=1 Tax=Pandoraea faecigallinarum TaxID=656179 RepID=A0A0H3WVM5_9BURK|nr:hypothetical protein [Pandoraea faecigallinarum]AKM30591.1 hypothetical protein AB870_11455 [Pandoraea faecigallinarum]